MRRWILFLHGHRLTISLVGVLVLSAVNVIVTRVVVIRLDQADRERVRAVERIFEKEIETMAAFDSAAAVTRAEVLRLARETRSDIDINALETQAVVGAMISMSDSIMEDRFTRLDSLVLKWREGN